MPPAFIPSAALLLFLSGTLILSLDRALMAAATSDQIQQERTANALDVVSNGPQQQPDKCSAQLWKAFRTIVQEYTDELMATEEEHSASLRALEETHSQTFSALELKHKERLDELAKLVQESLMERGQNNEIGAVNGSEEMNSAGPGNVQHDIHPNLLFASTTNNTESDDGPSATSFDRDSFVSRLRSLLQSAESTPEGGHGGHGSLARPSSHARQAAASMEKSPQTRRPRTEDHSTDQQQNTAANLEAIIARLHYLESITRTSVPKSCHDLHRLGVRESGKYLIDPDGPGIGEPPFEVQCVMTNDKGLTSVDHQISRRVVDIPRCELPGCHVTTFEYTASIRQIKALQAISKECHQSLRVDCFSAPLEENGRPLFWWTGSDGNARHYWHGTFPDNRNHSCACSVDDKCVFSPSLPCNCDSSAARWLSDEGNVTDVEGLPVLKVHAGGLKLAPQAAKIRVGPMICSGKKESRPTKSCSTQLLAGHTSPGFYLVDGAKEGESTELVQCNMDKEPADQNFQINTGYKIIHKPIAFRASITKQHYVKTHTVIPYEAVDLNEGGAMTPEGVFTAPLSGLYWFSFAFMGNAAETAVTMRVDGKGIITMAARQEYDTSTINTILKLSPDQKVDMYLFHNVLYIDAHRQTHFSGYLVQAL